MLLHKLPKVKFCCCGCSLKTGTLIFLCLGLMIKALNILGILSTVLINGILPYISILYVLITSAIYILGIYGAAKNRPRYLIPYLVLLAIPVALTIIFMIFMIFGCLITVIFLPSTITKGAIEIVILTIIGEICCLPPLALFFYIFIVGWSFFNELKADKQEILEESEK